MKIGFVSVLLVFAISMAVVPVMAYEPKTRLAIYTVNSFAHPVVCLVEVWQPGVGWVSQYTVRGRAIFTIYLNRATMARTVCYGDEHLATFDGGIKNPQIHWLIRSTDVDPLPITIVYVYAYQWIIWPASKQPLVGVMVCVLSDCEGTDATGRAGFRVDSGYHYEAVGYYAGQTPKSRSFFAQGTSMNVTLPTFW